ncbi:unnamed protein product [Cuscuta epithymum]|uniref:Uncharacterized protein n=1 Tax=Cuscuta epithymum TaxID=186058 RepID=A0AAV0FL50_9ASTE|nr:unnamed protein product [Cuscuta epithymum]
MRTGNSKRKVTDDTSELKCYATRSRTMRSRTTDGMSGKGAIAMTISVKNSPGSLGKNTAPVKINEHSRKRMDDTPAMTVLPVPLKSSPASVKRNENSKRNQTDDSPRLFTSSFQIPKLRISSAQVG